MKPKNSLIIGSGTRVQTHILPVLLLLNNKYNIVAVYSRTHKIIQPLKSGPKLRTITSLESVNFTALDVIIIAAALSAVPSILKQLSHFPTKNITLLLDTPVVPHTQLASLKYLNNFSSVHVTEDLVFSPIYLQAKKLINQSKIGSLRHIILFHSGYKYHALASLAMIAKSHYLPWIRYRRFSATSSTINIRLSRYVTATIIEPRDYPAGRFLIVGSQGTISDYPLSSPNHYQVCYHLRPKGKYLITVNNTPETPNNLDRLFLQKISEFPKTNSPSDLLKNRALVSLFSDLATPNPTFSYTPTLGLYHRLSLMIAETVGIFIDLPLVKTSLFRLLLLAFAKSVRSM